MRLASFTDYCFVYRCALHSSILNSNFSVKDAARHISILYWKGFGAICELACQKKWLTAHATRQDVSERTEADPRVPPAIPPRPSDPRTCSVCVTYVCERRHHLLQFLLHVRSKFLISFFKKNSFLFPPLIPPVHIFPFLLSSQSTRTRRGICARIL